MRGLVFGLLAGLLLSLGRMPGSFDLFGSPAPFAAARYGVRALALGLIGGALLLGGRGRRGLRSNARSSGPGAALRILAGVVLGFALHGLLLADFPPFAGSTSLVLGLLVLFVLAWRAALPGVARPGVAPEAEPSRALPAEPGASGLAGWVGFVGVAGAGAGAALALEGAARWVALMSDGTRADGTVLALAFLLAALLGGVSFGGLAGARALRGLALPVGLVALASSALVSLKVLGSIASPRGLFRYFQHPVIHATGIEATQHGMFGYDLLVGASCFVLPGMIAGALFVAAWSRTREAAPGSGSIETGSTGIGFSGAGSCGASLIGAACGLAAVPGLLSEVGVELDGARLARIGADLVPFGAAIAALGAVPAVIAARRSLAARLAGVVVAAGLGLALHAFVRVEPAVPVAPWRRAPAPARVTLETPEGVFTLEELRFGVESVTLNRRALAPGRDQADFDAARLRVALQLSDPFRRARGELRVLFVGQLTPGRWHGLRELGAGSVDRCAAWWRAMETIEVAVFQGAERPPGAVVAPDVARDRAAQGAYDLVLVPSVEGDQPRRAAELLDRFDAGGAVAILWLDPRFPLDAVELGDEVLLIPGGVAGLGVGLVRNAPPELLEGLLTLPVAGRVFRAPVAGMQKRAEERSYANLERFSRRLLAAAPPSDRFLPEALTAYFGAQHQSSPYEDPAARIELPAAALDALLEHSLAHPLDAFTRGLWEEIALVLAGKRWVPEILDALPPLVDRHRPWPVIQRVLAQGLLESFEPEEALAVLTADGPPVDRDGWACLGEAQRMLGDHVAAAEALREAHRLDPDHHEVHRALAIEAVLAGAPDGQALVEEILEEHPGDEGILPYRGPGPYPEPGDGFRPNLFAPTHR